MQNGLPRLALEHNFLLCGIFASAALHMASSCEKDGSKTAMYSRAALQYYNRGSAEFRRELYAIRPEIIHLLYLHAAIGASASLLLPNCLPEPDGVSTSLDRIMVFFDMAIGATTFLEAHQAQFERALTSVSAVRSMTNLATLQRVSDEDRDVMDRVVRITSRHSAGRSQLKHALYQKAIERLCLCFTADSVKGFCLSFPKYCGPEFTAAVKQEDPMALILLEYWAVLLHRLKSDYWWIRSVGREIIVEISCKLSKTILWDEPEVADAVCWPLEQTEHI